MAKLYIKNTDGTFTPRSSIAVTKLDVVQDKGNSLTSAMSQKAVTDELETKQSVLTDTDGGYGQRVAELEKEGIASQEKLTELEHISTYQEEYVLSIPNSVLDKYFVSASGIIKANDSYHIDLYKLEANKKYIIRRKVEWPGTYAGFVCVFEPSNFIDGGTATSVICGSTTTVETEVSYEQDTYISILSNVYRGTFYEIATFINKGSADLKKEVDNISKKMISIESNVRRKLLIKRTDNNVQLYEKMLQAHEMGNTDVCFETGTYELNEIYSYMKNTLGYTSMYEMQIGNGCRYYLNGSTIISKHVDGIPDTARSVFGTRMKSTDYEIYDGILITDGGHYVVHDDTQNYEQQYRHVYKNITFKTSNDDGHRIPDAPLGCGTGKFVDIIFEDCIFESLTETDFFCHGIINDTSHQTVTLRLTFSNCFFSGFVGLTSYLTNEDDIKLVVANCSLERTDTIQHGNKCKYLNMFNNQVRE